MATQPVDPWASLAAGILAQAGRDAKKGDPGAMEWLLGEEADHICEALNVDREAIKRFAQRQLAAQEAARMKNNQTMNDFIRGKTSQKQQAVGITDEQAGRIEKFVATGATFAEAWDLVLSAQPAQPTPPGKAGSGTGNPPPAKADMNALLRKKTVYG